MNAGSKLTLGLVFFLGVLQLTHAFNHYTQFGSINWPKILAGIACFGVTIGGFYWIKRNAHRTR